jgi:hypothetical protein
MADFTGEKDKTIWLEPGDNTIDPVAFMQNLDDQEIRFSTEPFSGENQGAVLLQNQWVGYETPTKVYVRIDSNSRKKVPVQVLKDRL